MGADSGMKPETRRLLNTMILPTLIAAIVVIIGIVVIEYASVFIETDRTVEGLTLLSFGGMLAIGAMLWWGIATEIQHIRMELNDMRKEP